MFPGLRRLMKFYWKKPKSCFAYWTTNGYRCCQINPIVIPIAATTMNSKSFIAAYPLFFPFRQTSTKRKRAALVSSSACTKKPASISKRTDSRKSVSSPCPSTIFWTTSRGNSASGTNGRNTCRTSITGRLSRGDSAPENREDGCWSCGGTFYRENSLSLFPFSLFFFFFFYDLIVPSRRLFHGTRSLNEIEQSDIVEEDKNCIKFY